jgi:penicillin-binding protein 1A
MISLLRGAVASGTGKAAALGRPVAGKTGTTNNFKDAWFVGFTPEITTGVWMGYDKMGLSLGAGQAGGALAAPVFSSYLRLALKDEPVRNFPSYAALKTKRVCERSGMLPSTGCFEIIDEVFVPNSEPKDECDLCSAGDIGVKGATKAPKGNVTKEHSDSVIKAIKDDKKNKFMDDVSNDLLSD